MINPQIAPHPVSWNRQNIAAAIHSAGTITLFAAGVLGSMTLAHFNYSALFKTTLAVAFINLYAFTKVLRYGSSRMIRAVLGINLAALGALSLGGYLTPALRNLIYIPGIKLSFSDKVLVKTVTLFAFTFITGYAAAPSLKILKKAYSILNDSHWATYCERLEHLNGHTPEAGFGLLQANLIPNAAWPFWFFTITPGIESLNAVMDKFETFQARGQAPTPQENKSLLYTELQFTCDSFNFEEADKAGNVLLEKSPILLACLTKEEYADLFQRTLLRKMNANIDDFLNGILGLHDIQNRFTDLMQNLNQTEADLNREPTDALKQQLLGLIHGLCELKIKSEMLRIEKNRWHLLFQTWGDESQDLLQRFSQVERLKRTIGDPNIANRLDLFDLPENQEDLLTRLTSLKDRFHLGVEPLMLVKTISQRINEAIYRLCSMGLILVPVCIFPKFAAAGFGLGTVYFILKRFLSFPSILEEACSHAFRKYRMDIALDRKFFSLTDEARNRMETFTQADLLKKIRLLNHEILGTFGLIFCFAGIAQGVLLAKEVSEFFPV